jgi:hypothetical protein
VQGQKWQHDSAGDSLKRKDMQATVSGICNAVEVNNVCILDNLFYCEMK